MQVSIETTSGLERRMTVEVPAAVVESAVMARLQEAAGNVRLNGFRKGKIPLKVIKGRFGRGVRQEVVGEVMSKTYYQAINEQKLKPAGQPRIEPKSLEEGKNLQFVAIFEVFPEITLEDFSKLKVEKLVSEVADENIDKMVETLRLQRQTWANVTRQTKSKDRVNIDFKGTIDGEEFAGGSAQGTNLILGSDRMIPGFEKGLLKKKAGDEVVLDLTFPEDYHSKELAGKAVKFAVKINSVSAPVLPELNDEFFAVFGIEEGGEEAFRKEVAANMSRELNNASKAKLKNRVMDLLIAQNKVTLPGSLVKSEIAALRQQALQQFGGGKQNIDPAMLPDELFREQAEKRIALGLILGEVIKTRNLKADPALVKSTIEDIASTYETPEQVVRWYYSNKEQLAAVESSVLEDQAFDAILAEAKVTEKKVSYDDVIKPDTKAGK
ncbi:MAG: trigger factor [Gammaproteobacteria bacterium RIFCSPLOWO2_02_FULL_57_10]|nr:MAG: trigger factor [Gammaproteobacteria bacterium RIFCSPLOWO2_02_FULL_57_10]